MKFLIFSFFHAWGRVNYIRVVAIKIFEFSSMFWLMSWERTVSLSQILSKHLDDLGQGLNQKDKSMFSFRGISFQGSYIFPHSSAFGILSSTRMHTMKVVWAM